MKLLFIICLCFTTLLAKAQLSQKTGKPAPVPSHQLGPKLVWHGNENSLCAGGGLYYMYNSEKKFSLNPGLGITYFVSGASDVFRSSRSKFYGLEGNASFKYKATDFFYLSLNGGLNSGVESQNWELRYADSGYIYGKSKYGYFIGSVTLGAGLRLKNIDFNAECGLSSWDNGNSLNAKIGLAYLFKRKS